MAERLSLVDTVSCLFPAEMASFLQVVSEAACEISLPILAPTRPSFCYREELVQQHSGGVLHSTLRL